MLSIVVWVRRAIGSQSLLACSPDISQPPKRDHSSGIFFGVNFLLGTCTANDDDIWAPPRPTPSRHSPPPPPSSAFFFSIFGVLLSFHVFKLGSSALSLKQRHCTVQCSGFGKLRLISDLWSSLVRHAVTGATLESRPIHFWPFVPSPLGTEDRAYEKF